MKRASDMLLLTPSQGFGGGIERVADAIQACWPEEVTRVNLYRSAQVASPSGNPRAKMTFGARATARATSTRARLIVANHVGLLPVAHVAARITRARVAVIGHGIEVWSPMPARRAAQVRACDSVAAVSSFSAEWMARRAGLEPAGIHILPLPVSPEIARHAEGPAPRVADRGPVLLTVSRIVSENRYKCHFEVARALPHILAAVPDARWVVIGDGDDLPLLRTECDDLGVSRAVDFRGAVSEADLIDAYGQASAFVLPSVADPTAQPPTGEGFGLVYAEAACFGVPSVAATAGGGSADFVEDGVTGLCVHPDDRRALAAAIARLLSDAALRARLGAAARDRVRSRHLPRQFGDQLVRVLGAG